MMKFFSGLLLGMFLATWGIDGVFTFTENVLGIAKTQIEQVVEPPCENIAGCPEALK